MNDLDDLIERKPVSKWRRSMRKLNANFIGIFSPLSLRVKVNLLILLQFIIVFGMGFTLDHHTELSQGEISLWVTGGMLLVMAEFVYFDLVIDAYNADDN